MKIYIGLFSALSLVNLAKIDAQLANIPAKLHRAGERRELERREARRRVAADVDYPSNAHPSAVMSMPKLEQSELEGSSTPTLAHTLAPSVGALTGSSASPTLVQTDPPTSSETTTPPVTTTVVPPVTTTVTFPVTTTVVDQALPAATESPSPPATTETTTTTTTTTPPVPTTFVPTYSPTMESSALPMSLPLFPPTYYPMAEGAAQPVSDASPVQTLSPTTETPTQSMPNVKPNDMDRQGGELVGPTTSPAPTVSAAPTSGPPVSTTLSPIFQPTTDGPTQSPISPVAPTLTPITMPVTKSPSGPPVSTPSTEPPTDNPTRNPTIRSTDSPTSKPTHVPTRAPTDALTTPPTPNPTNEPTNKPTVAPTSSKPTISPSNKPVTSTPTILNMTKSPTRAPKTTEPTNKPSSTAMESPTSSPIDIPIETTSPALTPTASPNAGSSANKKSPSLSPTFTVAPTLKLNGPVQTPGLKMNLTGIEGIPDTTEWEKKTSSYFAKVYDETYNPFTYDHVIEVTMTQVASVGSRRERRLNARSNTNRALQADMAVEVTYTQDMWYRSEDPNIDPTTAFNYQLPLSTEKLRDGYVGELKTLQGYEGLTSVSEIFLSSGGGGSSSGGGGGDSGGDTGGGESKGWSTGLIVGVVVGTVVALTILVLGIAHYNKKKDEDGTDENPTVMEYSNAQDMTTVSGTAMGSSVHQSYENQTVGTMDYDYASAFGRGTSAGEAASEAGGTLGSRTRQTAADMDDMAIVSGVTELGGVSIFSEDPTFDQIYEANVHEEILNIYAPAGKLGVVIDTPNEGAPVVHAVKETSIIAGKIQVGDKLVAVDDDDVRTMTAIKVSKLLSQKSNNESRKLTVVRLVKNDKN